MAQCPVYLIIGNLSHKIQRLGIRLRGMIVGLIPIHKRDFLKIKIEIYYQTMRVIIKCKSNCHIMRIVIWPNITALEKAEIEGLLMMCAHKNVQQCHPIITSISVNYEEQVIITGIKLGMQCSICLVPPNKREDLCKKWQIRTDKRTVSQLAL